MNEYEEIRRIAQGWRAKCEAALILLNRVAHIVEGDDDAEVIRRLRALLREEGYNV